MVELEIWVRCLKAVRVAKTDGLHVVSEPVCPCHGAGEDTLVRVPDGAVERMEPLLLEREPWFAGTKEWAERLLRAAVGGEGL